MGPPGADRKIRVAVVEEHDILRFGLVACLAEDRAVEVSAAEAEGLGGRDVDLALVSSDAASRRRFGCPIVVCRHNGEDPSAVAERNHVAGVVHPATATAAQLRATVHAAAAGLRVVPEADDGDGSEPIDARARHLLTLIAEGYNTREIADRMSYSERTIKKLVTGLESQLQARTRAQMVALAVRRGLI